MKSAGVSAGSLRPVLAEISTPHAPKMPADRAFGLTFAGVFALVAAVAGWQRQDNWLIYAGIADVFALAALLAPSVLHPLNVAWMALGNLLNHIVSPLVMGAIFFVVITPVALAMRIRGRDVLQRRFDPERPSYWIERNPPGPVISDFPRQF